MGQHLGILRARSGQKATHQRVTGSQTTPSPTATSPTPPAQIMASLPASSCTSTSCSISCPTAPGNSVPGETTSRSTHTIQSELNAKRWEQIVLQDRMRGNTGCCPQHPSTQYPSPFSAIYQPQLDRQLPAALEALVPAVPEERPPEYTPQPSAESDAATSLRLYLQAGLDLKFLSSQTIPPLHPVIPYHLSHNHLNCIHRQRAGNDDSSNFFIRSLSASGEDRPPNRATSNWSNCIFFRNQTFLQIQSIGIVHRLHNQGESHHFTPCPHQRLSITAPVFERKAGRYEVTVTIVDQKHGCPARTSVDWSSQQGDHLQLYSCEICHCDAEFRLEYSGQKHIHIAYVCYKNLGSGTDPTSDHWLTVIGRKHKSRNMENDRYQIFPHVWNTAKLSNFVYLRDYTYQTPYGPFKVSSGFIRD